MNAIACTDQELVRQILAGRPEAFSLLVERHLRSALAVARARLLNPADADDAVQEAFLRAYTNLASLRDAAKFGPWFLTITRHEALRLVARGRRIDTRHIAQGHPDPADLPNHSEAPNPSELTAGHGVQPDHAQLEMNALLREHIAKLPEAAREVLLLHYFAGHSTREIATLLELRQGAVLKRLQRAREHLAETLLRDLEDERPALASLAKQATRIAALASAISLEKAVAGSAATAAAALFVPKAATLAAGLLGAVATLAGVAFFIHQAQEQPASAQNRAQPVAPADSQTAPANPADAQAPLQANRGRPTATPTAATAAPGETSAESEARPNATPAQVRLDSPVTLAFEDVHLAKILAFLEGSTQAPFLIDTRAVGVPASPDPLPTVPPDTRPYPVDGRIDTVRIDNRPLDQALDEILAGIGLKAVLAPGYLWISTPDQVRRDGMAYPRAQYEGYPGMEAFKKPISITFDDVHLSEVLLFLNEYYETPPIVLDTRVIAPAKGPAEYPVFSGIKCTDGKIRYINLKNVRLHDCLRILARMTNTSFIVREDYIWFTTDEMLRRDGLASAAPPQRKAMDKVLASPITVAFEDVSILEIFGFVHEIYDINVVFDQRVLVWKNEQADAVPPLQTKGDSRPVSNGMIHFVSVKNVALKSALEILTHDLDLAYELRADAIVFSTAEAFASGEADGASLISAQEFATSSIAAIQLSQDAIRSSNKAETQGKGAERAAQAAEANHRPQLDEIRNDGGSLKAKIHTGISGTWYSAGMHFGDFKLEGIDAAAGCVTLLNEKTNQRSTICVK